MTDEVAAVEAPEAVHVTGVVSRDLSEDGNTAMIVFKVAGEDGAPERNFALTIPAIQITWLRGIINDLCGDVARRGMQGAKLLHFPSVFSIGWSEQLKGPIEHDGNVIVAPGHGATMIVFDTMQPTEQVFAMANLAALKLAEDIRRDVMPRLTMIERNDMKMLLQKPPQQGIIRPGG